MKTDDVVLIQFTLAGDEAAFATLVNKYQEQVHAYTYRKIGDYHIAEDITQETFFEVYQNLGKLRDPTKFSTWLFAIANYLCIAWYRKNQSMSKLIRESYVINTEADSYSRYVALENERDAAEAQRELVQTLLSKLKESDQQLITLHYFEEMTSAEISRHLGVPQNTIKSRLRRAKQRLRQDDLLIQGTTDNSIEKGQSYQHPLQGEMSMADKMSADILKIKSLSDRSRMQLSADGEWLAYVVVDPDRRSSFEQQTDDFSLYQLTGALIENHSQEVRVTNLKTKETHQLGADEGVDWAPRWSPNGHYLAFCSDRMGTPHLWVWDRVKNKLRQVSEKPITATHGLEVPQWTSDGKHIITKLRPEDIDLSTIISNKTIPKAINVWHTDTDEQSSVDEELDQLVGFKGDLSLFNVDTGDLQILTRGLLTRFITLSPDNSAVAVLNVIGEERLTAQDTLYELLLVPLDGSAVRSLATNITDKALFVSWSPDGKRLIYAQPDGLYIVSVQDGVKKNLTANLTEKLQFYARPLWRPSGESFFCGIDGNIWEFAADGSDARKLTEELKKHIMGIVAKVNTHVVWQSSDAQSICVQTHDPETKKEGFYLINSAEARATCLFEEPISITRHIADEHDLRVVSNDTQIVYRAQDATHPEEVWMFDTDSGEQQQVSELNPHLRDLQFGEVRFVESEMENGERLRGVLMLPANYEEGKKYPLVTWVRPGRHLSMYIYTFGLDRYEMNFQLLAARGFAVLGVDVPSRSSESLKKLSEYVLPAVDKVIEMGIADADRLGIKGYGYGGYFTAGLITQTNRFKAAVCGGGFYNLTRIYGNLTKRGRSLGIRWIEGKRSMDIGGSLWEKRQRYIDSSPLFHLDKVETPVLIYSGEGFDRDDYTQSGELFSGLRRLEKKATFAWYRGEGHIVRYWRPEHRADCWERIIDWFEKHLN
ncbi:MAG: sigma-70 family RNA polymerase sigma factor [Candidatus Poribacteria bacterium]|nr:sigma-70 family RNA polymerase sigma factor [Candidatus Poribacteria bacterium]